MPKLNAILIDDEQDACDLLKGMLQHSGEFEQVKSYTDPLDGFQQVLIQNPDVLFLDIQMPGLSGIDIIRKLQPWLSVTNVVLVTAYSEYGLEAAKNNAFDYLLKPIEQSELNSLITKLKASASCIGSKEVQSKPTDRLLIWSTNGVEMLQYEQIVYLEADKNYSSVYLINDDTILSSRSLGRIEKDLPEDIFVRISRKHIINNKFLRSVNFKDKLCCMEWENQDIKLKYTRKLSEFIKE